MSNALSIELATARGDGSASRCTLRLGQTFVVGRGPKAVIRIDDDPDVAARHASLELRPEGLFVTDLGSQTGTRLDGACLPPRLAVEASQAKCLEVGAHSLRIRSCAAPEAPPLPPPELPSDEFRILGLISRGGATAIYACEQLLLRRRVAVKVLVAHAQEEPRRERFLREARSCSQLQSPYVVDVYDVRSTPQQVCVIMELVQGPSLRDVLAEPLPVVETLRIGGQIALALEASEQAGIVHQAVRPSKVLLDPSGSAKLCGFGTAPTLEESPAPCPYRSPEQWRDPHAVDARADVYGLGATLYHLLSGSPPPASNSGRLLKPLRELALDAAAPAALCELVELMLLPDRQQRPASFTLFARLLRELWLDALRPRDRTAKPN